MITLKANLLGIAKADKTTIGRRLVSEQPSIALLNSPYKPTVAPDFTILRIQNDAEQINVQLWDIPGDPTKKEMAAPFMANSHFGLYCVDLSIEMTEEMVSAAKNEINEYRRLNPESQLILVGTKKDGALPQALEKAQNLLAEIPFTHIISTSAQEKNGLQELHDFLTGEAKKISQPIKRPCCCPQTSPLNAILKARNRCAEESGLYHALDSLNNNMQHMGTEMIEAIGEEANIMLDNLSDPSVTDKATSINLFVENSNERLQGKHHTLKNVILSVAITAAVTIMAAMIGFGIGFALGVWSGPGAFFTGLAAGCANALAVAGGASLFGMGTLAYTAHRFFRTTPVQESIHQVAEAANESAPVQSY